MSKIATICEESKEAKPYLSARHDRETNRSSKRSYSSTSTQKAAISYARWHPVGDEPKDAPLWAPV